MCTRKKYRIQWKLYFLLNLTNYLTGWLKPVSRISLQINTNNTVSWNCEIGSVLHCNQGPESIKGPLSVSLITSLPLIPTMIDILYNNVGKDKIHCKEILFKNPNNLYIYSSLSYYCNTLSVLNTTCLMTDLFDLCIIWLPEY